jgi:hypothetical protein
MTFEQTDQGLQPLRTLELQSWRVLIKAERKVPEVRAVLWTSVFVEIELLVVQSGT